MKISDLRQFRLCRNGAIVSIVGFPMTRAAAKTYVTLTGFFPNDKINLVKTATIDFCDTIEPSTPLKELHNET